VEWKRQRGRREQQQKQRGRERERERERKRERETERVEMRVSVVVHCETQEAKRSNQGRIDYGVVSSVCWSGCGVLLVGVVVVNVRACLNVG